MRFAPNCPFSDPGLITSTETGRSFFISGVFEERNLLGKLKVECQDKREIDRLKSWIDLSKIIQYLKERENEGGGFNFAIDLYPDIEDTYYATRIVRLLNADIDRNNMANYLKNISWGDAAFPRAVYMLLYLHLSVGIELPHQLINLIAKDWSGFGFLDAQYFCDEIWKLLGQPTKLLASPSLFQFYRRENLQNLRKKVSVLINHCIDFDRPQIIRWVQSSQNGDGGFGFYPETTSYMENTYCALEILSKLESTPMKIDLCQNYILSCQTASGGFGRAPVSFPFIESTFHAGVGLRLLGRISRET